MFCSRSGQTRWTSYIEASLVKKDVGCVRDGSVVTKNGVMTVSTVFEEVKGRKWV